MKKNITKTHEQAELERKQRNDAYTCPHCGTVTMFGIAMYKDTWFRKDKQIGVKCSCAKCGTEWEALYE